MREIVATVLENKRIAENVYSLTFATEGEVKVRPGQFCMLGVRGFPLRRPFAVCKAENDRITVGYQIKGRGTKTLSAYQAGDKLSALLPLGNGFYVAEKEKKIAIVGGGAGIFPLISVIRAYAESKEIHSYMGFRNRAAVCMQYEMQRGELTIATDDGSLGYRGTAVQAFMEDIGALRPDVILSCGPTPMLRALKKAVEGRNIPTYVSLEERMGCGVGACLVCVCEKSDGSRARVCRDGPVFDINDVEL